MTIEFIAHEDWSRWLAPLSDNEPCGPDLEYDPQFRELEEAVNGVPEAEYGTTLVAAVPADWTAADVLSAALLDRTRDLRVIAMLARARLAREGFEALADALALSAALLEHEWQCVHPQLDANDGNDPTARVNALAAWVEPAGMLAEVSDAPLTKLAQPVTLREWTYANGDVKVPEGRTARSVSEIEAALAAAPDALLRTNAAFEHALGHVDAIEALMAERIDAAQALDLGPLKTLLLRGKSLFTASLARSGVTQATQKDTSTHIESNDESIGGRADVAATLRRLCDYYARHEPASPVPLLLTRAITLIDKSFVDLMKDLAPEGLAQLTQVIGVSAVESAEE